MAEERLIDDDKDRKYKIRKNADGEDELVIDDTPDEEEESDIPVFRIPVYKEDDEEAAVLSPEQLAEREQQKLEEQAAREQKLQGLLEKAGTKLNEGDFEAALYAVSQAEELAGDNGEVYCLKLKSLTRNFTDYISLEKCAEAADGVKKYADGEQKAQLKEMACGLNKRIADAEDETNALSEQNEAGKAERRGVFALNKKNAFKNFLITAVPFVVMLILAISFSTVIFAAENGAFVVVTIVCAALAFIALVATLFTANRLWAASRNVKLNERDTSTKLGREYLAKKNELELLKRINSAFDNDLS